MPLDVIPALHFFLNFLVCINVVDIQFLRVLKWCTDLREMYASYIFMECPTE